MSIECIQNRLTWLLEMAESRIITTVDDIKLGKQSGILDNIGQVYEEAVQEQLPGTVNQSCYNDIKLNIDIIVQ